MKAIAPSRAAKLLLLGTLYFSQGLPFGFFTQALPVLMRKEGFSLGAIGLSSLVATPWALEFLWAPAVDRFSMARLGRRKSWILPLQLASFALLVALALLPPTMTTLLVACFLLSLVAATQDIATDGLAVELLQPQERGWGNGGAARAPAARQLQSGRRLCHGHVAPLLSDLGLELKDMGWLLGTVGFCAGLAGALAGGALVQRLGRRRSLLSFGVL